MRNSMRKISSQTQGLLLRLLHLPDLCQYQAHFLMKLVLVLVLVMMTTTTILES
jgi:hypothetical protein